MDILPGEATLSIFCLPSYRGLGSGEVELWERICFFRSTPLSGRATSSTETNSCHIPIHPKVPNSLSICGDVNPLA